MSIETILAKYVDPWTGVDFATTKTVKQVTVTDNNVVVVLCLHYPNAGIRQKMADNVAGFIRSQSKFSNVTVHIETQLLSHTIQSGLKSHAAIKNIIAVASGKGGVGKSTTAVNLALALHAEGARVGILDADIYGPSQPVMLGTATHKGPAKEGALTPVLSHGIQSMSIGYLIDSASAVAWRGPMVSGALQQLLTETQWDELDYLIVDMPPGTGDIHLTLAQKIPVSGAIIVTTPQDIALLDARRAVNLFQKVNIPVLGIVENMGIHVCSNCGQKEAIFGHLGGEKMAQEYQVALLGQLPLDIRIREQADGGTPTVAVEPESVLGMMYRDIARRMAAKLSLQTKNYGRSFPSIVIADS